MKKHRILEPAEILLPRADTDMETRCGALRHIFLFLLLPGAVDKRYYVFQKTVPH